ncbi:MULTISPECIES: glucose-1-phosphate adenylyltransferase [Planococcus]|uniref:Glucose-1-phosphate adenylyltransferase n=1 Tax=Planococcus faecalis TaxID=1598147 RepID=A0ABN4XLV3_9BACL|nr:MULTISPECIES: glucose-1-phosphate adenylyltransferase [Planococcus]AQU78099.1 glucose-1-phosphate adenylyltransferase [Planococcus faecalis]KAA0957323.1 glucose-1-phosphate adenylyltransferase [Planococcus sp. ANT_H30]MDJ0331272.1 glucose-1-phosphate adenylyltransferase [Planococcus sp. S3-L1]OHX53707.1 glucose-1-phosphate adenylyltransferase [Planococcus faecalis]
MNDKVVAMLLAGGQGSRLKSLTYTIAKPALPFGGKYRIIDFPLSNCTNSGINTVGVLTQYQPHVLHEYIGLGTPWDLDRRHGGVTMLPPYTEIEGVKWYAGTASAIYQNINYLTSCDPEYVLILSGDHIYKMDYEVLIDYHKEHEADVTISVLEVPWEEASRFGVINVDDSMIIKEFDEKPENPKSNLASMGVYVFKWKKLKEYLEIDNLNKESSHDFGMDILPAMLEKGEKMIAYPFKGYWKDVGTVESLWEANMDLLDLNSGLNLHDSAWRIFSSNPQLPPQVINKTGNVQSSMVNEGCVISGDVSKSVVFQKVTIEEGAAVSESVIMSGSTIKKGAKLHRVIVPPNLEVPEGFEIHDQQDEVVLLIQEQLDEWKEREGK